MIAIRWITIFSWVLTGCDGKRVTSPAASSFANEPPRVATQPAASSSTIGELGKLDSQRLYFQTRSLISLRFTEIPLLYGESFLLVNHTTKSLLGGGTLDSTEASLWLDAAYSQEGGFGDQGFDGAESLDSERYGLVEGKSLTLSLMPTDRRLAGKLTYGRNLISLLFVQDNRRPVSEDIRLVLRDFPVSTLGTARFESEWMGQRVGGYQGRLGWFSHVQARSKDTVLTSGLMQILHK